jgi:hypothetical protein
MEICKQTRISQNGMTFHQIDHILIERRWATNILNTRSYRGACCVCHHFLVTALYNSILCVSELARIAQALNVILISLRIRNIISTSAQS